MRKRLVIALASLPVLLLVVVLSLKLEKSRDLGNDYSLPAALAQQVAAETHGMSEDEIVGYSVRRTAAMLRFAAANDIDGGKANCVGYAQLCAAICNRALATNGHPAVAHPARSYVKSCGVNLCALLAAVAPSERWRLFVKDHDFVQLRYDGRDHYFDPSLYDITANDCMTIK